MRPLSSVGIKNICLSRSYELIFHCLSYDINAIEPTSESFVHLHYDPFKSASFLETHQYFFVLLLQSVLNPLQFLLFGLLELFLIPAISQFDLFLGVDDMLVQHL